MKYLSNNIIIFMVLLSFTGCEDTAMDSSYERKTRYINPAEYTLEATTGSVSVKVNGVDRIFDTNPGIYCGEDAVILYAETSTGKSIYLSFRNSVPAGEHNPGNDRLCSMDYYNGHDTESAYAFDYVYCLSPYCSDNENATYGKLVITVDIQGDPGEAVSGTFSGETDTVKFADGTFSFTII